MKGELERTLTSLAAPMELVSVEERQRVRCLACAHRCLVPPGSSGVCKVRFNREGTLFGPRGYVSGLQNDPVEKKPFFHVLPGTDAMSFGMLGCCFHCSFCQNWLSSQALRDEAAGAAIRRIEAREIVALARSHGSSLIASTYNEPLITTEWAVEVFRLAQAAGLRTAFVSNGYNTGEGLDYLRPWLDVCNVDLKCFNDATYRKLGGRLQPVLDGIQRLYRAGVWVEVVSLIVPGMNDTDRELRAMAGFIAEISQDIPWHVTAFYPTYRMQDRQGTPLESLVRAWRMGKEVGLRHIYPGNTRGQLEGMDNTVCPHCRALLVERRGYSLLKNRLQDGRCPDCQAEIPGRWHAGTGSPG
ncbi:MAG: AmmeMemoRadiSam system radical SAM enzyme [Deltaproteobacteria bacterium]|nr:AmmeMemoRadiSam system radical SAM enzyme [Deltaproteobacteria bacterium]